MLKLATITSKRQLTIPSNIFKEIGLKEGEKVLIGLDEGRIYIEPARDLIENLAGSVSLPKRFKDLEIEKVIIKAKDEYFKNK